MSPYAVGKKAFGFCDRCGFRYPLEELKKETINASNTDLKVCYECRDPDHPQNSLGRVKFSDPQSLYDPRPDTGLLTSRYGDSIRWDFETGVDYWVSGYDEDVPSMTVVWAAGTSSPSDVSVGEEIAVTGIAGQKTPILVRDGTTGFGADNSAAVSVDTSVYKVIRMRMKRTVPWISSSGSSGWVGSLHWNNTGRFWSSSKVLYIAEPNWSGEAFETLTWEVGDSPEWDTGSAVNRLKITFHEIGSDTWTNLGSYTIDYIRAEVN